MRIAGDGAERDRAMSIIAVFNQKGGVGKTTTALNLLAAIAQRGQRPLGIDLDPQAHLSHVFGAHPKLADDSIYSFFVRQRPLDDIAPHHEERRRPLSRRTSSSRSSTRCSARASTSSPACATRCARPTRRPGPVVIDTCPLFNVLSLNAVFACDLLLVPGLVRLPGAARRARSRARVERAGAGVQAPAAAALPAHALRRAAADERRGGRADGRRRCAPEEICVTRIRESVKLAESPAVELDVFRHAPDSNGALDYQALVDELVSAGFVA